MDKTARLKYAFGMPTGEISPDDAPLNAIVVGVMSAVTAELSKSGDNEPESSTVKNPANIQGMPTPNPQLTPDQVLHIQLAALKLNDVPTPRHGIKVAFQFCTPESRDYLGSPRQLGMLFRDPKYAPLLDFQFVTFQSLIVQEHKASQHFTIMATDGTQLYYVAHLIKQQSGDEAGCWLTDAICHVSQP